MKKISDDVKLDYDDVLLVPQSSSVNSRTEVKLTKRFFDVSETHESKGIDIDVVPIIAANMDHVGTFEVAKELHGLKCMTCLSKHYKLDELENYFNRGVYTSLRSIYSMGTTEDDIEKFAEFASHYGDITNRLVCIDVANAYTDAFLRTLEKIANKHHNYTIIAGNVATVEGVTSLINAGASAVKIGIGPGSVCTTRRETGIGYPQFSAVMECAEIAHNMSAYVIADGGCTSPGDVIKALAGGADYVMLGGMLAGSDEGNLDCSSKESWSHSTSEVPFYGMASKEAQIMHGGEMLDYRSSEGKVVMLPRRGPIIDIVKPIIAGMRSACTYLGVSDISRIAECAKFIRVNRVLNSVFA